MFCVVEGILGPIAPARRIFGVTTCSLGILVTLNHSTNVTTSRQHVVGFQPMRGHLRDPTTTTTTTTLSTPFPHLSTPLHTCPNFPTPPHTCLHLPTPAHISP
ncbi:hypothetical protein E2C01_095978 [Portunus trituberculatus]|uniref:Uncharacterized protein n=1 Tax=Portunus trituberculatus TaxID=210409 RepID=A0A5B7JWS3_PORTR|nr:hypothetical protein [Portunus trituberculatus]